MRGRKIRERVGGIEKWRKGEYASLALGGWTPLYSSNKPVSDTLSVGDSEFADCETRVRRPSKQLPSRSQRARRTYANSDCAVLHSVHVTPSVISRITTKSTQILYQ